MRGYDVILFHSILHGTVEVIKLYLAELHVLAVFVQKVTDKFGRAVCGEPEMLYSSKSFLLVL